MADRTAGGFSDGWPNAPRWELDWVLNLIAPKETCCYDTKLTYCRLSPPQAGFDILCRTRLKGRSSDNQYRLAFPGSPVKTKVQESKGGSAMRSQGALRCPAPMGLVVCFDRVEGGVDVHSVNSLPVASGGLRPLFTVGHSILDFGQFAKLLEDSGVELVADVRSLPQSARLPHFSQPVLEKLLGDEHISYLFLGEELGGRPDDVDAYHPNGVVDYAARRKSYAFQRGVERLLKELEGRPVAMMCAEEDPLECHRFLMVCPELVKLGVSPLHLRKGGQIETQEAAENRLLAANGFASVAADTLFPQARSEALEDAYRLQAERFAFRVKPFALEPW